MFAFNGNQQLTTRYLNGPNTSAYDHFFSTLAEEDITSTTSEGTLTFDLLDMEGTLTDIANSSGALADHLEYNAYGQLFSESNPSVLHLGGYAGGLYDPTTGLVYFIERWYDPRATVWVSGDPIGFAAGDMDLTRYAGNKPTNARDPSGLDVWIEGSSGSEPAGHQSIGVGDPNGDYWSFSFGAECITWRHGLTGGVYIERGGPIDPKHYYKTSAKVDEAIKNALKKELGKKGEGPYRLLNLNCRTWSQARFEEIVRRLRERDIGAYSTPPARTRKFKSESSSSSISSRSTSRSTTSPSSSSSSDSTTGSGNSSSTNSSPSTGSSPSSSPED